jgi:hypothetical protein
MSQHTRPSPSTGLLPSSTAQHIRQVLLLGYREELPSSIAQHTRTGPSPGIRTGSLIINSPVHPPRPLCFSVALCWVTDRNSRHQQPSTSTQVPLGYGQELQSTSQHTRPSPSTGLQTGTPVSNSPAHPPGPSAGLQRGTIVINSPAHPHRSLSWVTNRISRHQ